MKKKTYITPEMQKVELHQSAPLLAGSQQYGVNDTLIVDEEVPIGW